MKRIILHSDLNSFYASVECLHRPEIREKPVAVAGSTEHRHGIILTRNQIAKHYGVKTGEAIWQAREKCPELVTVPPNFPLYLRYSKLARNIYADYSDRVEPFGIDECWIDLTGNVGLRDNGEAAAQEIRARIKAELGVTVSIGVSFDKIYSKLGSDFKKPDSITIFDREHFRERAWHLSAEDLLYVGPATRRKLYARNIRTIGALATTDPIYLRSIFGKMGDILHTFANGLDATPVARIGDTAAIKSVGNSCTAPRDLTCDEDAKLLIYVLAESVGARLREQGLCARTAVVEIRSNDLFRFERQCKLQQPSSITSEIADACMNLLRAHYHWERPIRSLGVRAADLCPKGGAVQLDFFGDEVRRERYEVIDETLDNLRRRFGNNCIQRCSTMQDPQLAEIDTKRDHIIHPVGYL